MVEFLPFLMECYYEGRNNKRRYLVTRVLAGFDHPHFKPDVKVISWNGTPIERAVERNAEREAGSNLSACLALGLQYMTVRWLGSSLPPDEQWVIVGYRDNAAEREIRLPWRLLAMGDDPGFMIGLQAVWLLEKSPATRTTDTMSSSGA